MSGQFEEFEKEKEEQLDRIEKKINIIIKWIQELEAKYK